MNYNVFQHGFHWFEKHNHYFRISLNFHECNFYLNRLKRTEEAARENKTALTQLISHTKNVERAVTMSQQDILTKKETQVQKWVEKIPLITFQSYWTCSRQTNIKRIFKMIWNLWRQYRLTFILYYLVNMPMNLVQWMLSNSTKI